MNHLFYGDDTFSIREAVSTLKAQAGGADVGDVNVTTFAAAGLSVAELLATCNTIPFLADKRVVIAEGVLTRFEQGPATRGGSRPAGPPALGDWEKLGDELPNIPDSTDLVLVDGQLSRNNALFSRIKSKVTVRTFPLPRGSQLREWVRTRGESKGMKVEPAAVNLLAETIGGDLDTLDSELKKLASYRMEGFVREEDVNALVSYTREASIFATVDAMIEGRAGVAIRLVHQLLDSGRPVAYLLTMMSRQIRLLLLAKDLKARGVPISEFGGRLKLSDYPLKKTLDQERRFTSDQLAGIHHMILKADLAMKSSSIDETTALELLVAEIASSLRNGRATAAAGR